MVVVTNIDLFYTIDTYIYIYIFETMTLNIKAECILSKSIIYNILLKSFSNQRFKS